MPSIRQIEANRQNARKSTGPNTHGGRLRSSRNALRHGLSAKNLVVGEEKADELEALHQSYIEEFDPKGPTELQLVNQMTVAALRMERAQQAEAKAFIELVPCDTDLSSSDTAQPSSDTDQVSRNIDELLKNAWWYNPDVIRPTSAIFDAMLRYSAIAERSWFRALSALIQLQERRGKRSDVSAMQTPHPVSDEVRRRDRAAEKLE